MTKLYTIAACPKRETHIVIENVTILMDQYGSDYGIIQYNMTKRMKWMSKAS